MNPLLAIDLSSVRRFVNVRAVAPLV